MVCTTNTCIPNPDFESLTKVFDKSKKVVEKEGVPRFYIRTIAELEDFANEVNTGFVYLVL